LNFTRFNLAAASAGNKVLFAGGANAVIGAFSTVDIFQVK
jgi:hypothetical protein